jgi:hypothetical protein
MGKPAWQGTTVDGKSARLATDGVTSLASGTCSIAGASTPLPPSYLPSGNYVPGGPWFVVDLGSNKTVNLVVVFGNGG